MAPPRLISRRQLEIMIDFLEENKGASMGLPPTGIPGASTTSTHAAIRQKWITLSKQLNAVPGGALKTPDGWKKYWIEWRHKSRKKANDARRFEESPDGGPSRFAPLNDLEVRVLALSGANLVRAKSKPIKELENMITENSNDSDRQSLEMVKLEPATTSVKAHKTRASSKKNPPVDNNRASTPPPQWALELEERRIAAEERMAAALESMASVMRVQEERRSMLEERIADSLTSVANTVQDLNSSLQEAVVHFQRIKHVNSNGPDIKEHVFL